MTRTAQYKNVVLVIGLLSTVCFLGCLAFYVRWRIHQMQWIAGVEKAAEQVGTEPTLDGLAEYVRESIEPGMSREQTHQVLSNIGELQILYGPVEDLGVGWGPTACDEIRVRVGPQPGHYWAIIGCYDHEDRLVSMQSDDDEDPWLGIRAPIQPEGVVPMEPEKSSP